LSIEKVEKVVDRRAVRRAGVQCTAKRKIAVRDQREQNEVSGLGFPRQIRVVFSREK
jgi:hypothetical protein